MWRHAAVIALAGLCCAGGPGDARATEKVVLPDFLIRSWGREDGLPSANVQAIARTPDGYLWAGTSRGLVRFDGVRFVVLTTNNTPELRDDRITCLLVTRTSDEEPGDLWIGSESGLLTRRRAGKFESVSVAAGAQGRRINAMVQDHEGSVWVATRGAGVARWRGGSWEVFNQPQGLPASGASQLAADTQGRMWAISGGRLTVLEKGRWQIAGELASVRTQPLAIAPARDGGIWVATGSEQANEMGCRVFRVKDRHLAWESTPYPWPQNTFHTRIQALFEDGDGRIWAGMATAGLYYREPGAGWQALGAKAGFSQILVNCLADDDAGNLWVGLDGAQLDQVRPRPVRTMHLPGTASQNVIRMAHPARDGSVWVGTDGAGVFRLRDTNWTQYGNAEGLRNAYIGVIFEDVKSNLWVGTWAGLSRLDGDRFVPELGVAPSPFSVRAMCQDREQNLWLGTGAGVIRMSGASARVVAGAEGYAGAEVLAIAQDKGGDIWAALSRRGLFRLKGDRFERAPSDPWAGQAEICSVLADADGGLWLGTLGRGIAYLKDGESKAWTSQDGLPSDWILALIEDEAGDLWFSSDNGIFGCPKARLRTYQRGASPPMLCWQLSVADGLETRRCSGVGQPVVARSQDGRLWFPNSRALAVFDPTSLQRGGSLHAPLLEEVFADGERALPGADGFVRVKSSVRSVEFHYTSPNLQTPERLRFRYQLSGADDGWVEADQRRIAYYSHLRPGDYEFRVMAGGPAGVWQQDSGSLRLKVVPRLWERPAVRVAGVLGLLGAVAASVWSVERGRSRQRLRRAEAQQEMERERQRIARDLHDDLGSDLTEIMLLGEMAAQQGTPIETVRKHCQSIAARSRQAAAAMDEIVWTVNPRNDSVPRLADRIAELARRLFDPLPIDLQTEITEDIPDIPLAATVRHHLYLAVKEAQNNAVKHSGASEVKVGVGCESGRLILTVHDNGRGFDSGQLSGSRNGLDNIRQRVESIGGRLNIESRPGAGTRVRMEYPLAQPRD